MNPCLIDYISSTAPPGRAARAPRGRKIAENPAGSQKAELTEILKPYRAFIDSGKSPFSTRGQYTTAEHSRADMLGVATEAGPAAGALEDAMTLPDKVTSRTAVALTTSVAAMAMAEVQLELYWQAVQFSAVSALHQEPTTGNRRLDDWLQVAHAPSSRGFAWENANLPFFRYRDLLYTAYTGAARGRWESYAKLLALRWEEHDRPHNAASFDMYRWVHELWDTARRITGHSSRAAQNAARTANASLIVVNNATTLAASAASSSDLRHSAVSHLHYWGPVGMGMAVVGGLYTQNSRATKEQRDTLHALAELVYSVAGAGSVETMRFTPPSWGAKGGRKTSAEYSLRVLEQAQVGGDMIAERGLPKTFRSLAAVLAELL